MAGAGLVKFVLANAYREYRIRLTNPILPLWDVVVPVVYLLVFGASLQRWMSDELAGIDYSAFLLGGVLGMVSFSVAMNSSYTYFEDLQSGIFHEMLTYPFPRRDLLLGRLLCNVIFSGISALVCIAAAAGPLGVEIEAGDLPGLVGWVFLGTTAWYFQFAWLALKVRGFNAYHTTTSSLYLLLMFVSNLFYPAARLPEWIQWLAWMNPITWQIDQLRAFTDPATASPFLLIEGIAFCLFLLLSYALANRDLNRSIE